MYLHLEKKNNYEIHSRWKPYNEKIYIMISYKHYHYQEQDSNIHCSIIFVFFHNLLNYYYDDYDYQAWGLSMQRYEDVPFILVDKAAIFQRKKIRCQIPALMLTEGQVSGCR